MLSSCLLVHIWQTLFGVASLLFRLSTLTVLCSKFSVDSSAKNLGSQSGEKPTLRE